MANTLMSLLVKLGLDAGDLDKGLAQAEGTAKKSSQSISQSMSKLSKSMAITGSALSLGLTIPLVKFGSDAIEAALEAEHAMAELNAVIKSTGGTAGVTAKQVTDYATAMQKVTKFDDEAIIGGQSMLLTFTKIGKDVFPQASTAMLNLAEKFGSVDQAAMQLGKALNDPVAGVGALRRVGVALSDQQEKQIKDFVAVGNVASAQKVILKELEIEFGGLAEAAGATNEGRLIQFNNTLGDLKEVIAISLLPGLIALTDNIKSLAEGFMKLPIGVQNAIVGFGVFLAALGPALNIGAVVLQIASYFAPGGALAGGLAGLAPIAAGAGTAFAGLAASIGAILLPLALVAAAVGLFYLAWKTNFGGIQETTRALVGLVTLWFQNMGETWDIICKLFAIAWEGGVTKTLEISWLFIKDVFMGGLNNLWNLLKGIGNFVATYFSWALNNLVNIIGWVVAAIGKLGNALSQLKLPWWLTPGSPTPMENGLVGIRHALDGVIGQTPAMAAGLARIDAQLQAMAIHFPAAQRAAMLAASFSNQPFDRYIKKGEYKDIYVKKGQYEDEYVKKGQYKDEYVKKGDYKDEYFSLTASIPASQNVRPANNGGNLTINLNVNGDMVQQRRQELISDSRKAAMEAFRQAMTLAGI